jgi:nicotinamide-nucleotide amidase
MKAEILAVGSELLTPRRTDTNSAYLTAQLASVGIPVGLRTTVGDELPLIAELFRQAVERAEVVLATGGLGPTADDLTREALADALGLTLNEDSAIVEGIRARFEKRGMKMPEVNRKQALVPEGADVLANRVGTAPGLWVPVARGDRQVVVALLPGPPNELQPMFEKEVLPRLARLAEGVVYRVKLLFVAGLPESAVEQRISELYRSVANPSTTILAGPGQVELHLTGWGASAEEAEARIEALAAPMRQALGRYVFSESGESLEQVVGGLLSRRGLTLATAESCTGGLILHRLTEVPGASSYVERGFVTYSNRSKLEMLGVAEELIQKHGAVSAEVAEAMARGARERARADLGLAVTGIAGPTGATAEKPLGLVFLALADSNGVVGRRLQLPGGRSQVKWWSSQAALDLLRLRLLEDESSEA